MKILILGANSYVGSRIYLELQNQHRLIGTYYRNKLSDDFIFLDITDKQAVLQLINSEKPEVIIHCANNASNKWCENHPEEAVKLNEEATNHIVEGANSVSAKIIYISSFAAITHGNLYGKTKLASEQIIKTANAGYLIIQPGIVIGFSPKIKKEDGFFSSIIENIDENKPARYDASKQYQPTHLGHICEVIKAVLERNIWGSTIPVAAPELKTKYGLANDILSPFGISVKAIENGQFVLDKEAQDLSELRELNLPIHPYQNVIQQVVDEIKHRERFIL